MRAGVFHNGKLGVVDVADPQPESGQRVSSSYLRVVVAQSMRVDPVAECSG
jgi:hypothetical protein